MLFCCSFLLFLLGKEGQDEVFRVVDFVAEKKRPIFVDFFPVDERGCVVVLVDGKISVSSKGVVLLSRLFWGGCICRQCQLIRSLFLFMLAEVPF